MSRALGMTSVWTVQRMPSIAVDWGCVDSIHWRQFQITYYLVNDALLAGLGCYLRLGIWSWRRLANKVCQWMAHTRRKMDWQVDHQSCKRWDLAVLQTWSGVERGSAEVSSTWLRTFVLTLSSSSQCLTLRPCLCRPGLVPHLLSQAATSLLEAVFKVMCADTCIARYQFRGLKIEPDANLSVWLVEQTVLESKRHLWREMWNRHPTPR